MPEPNCVAAMCRECMLRNVDFGATVQRRRFLAECHFCGWPVLAGYVAEVFSIYVHIRQATALAMCERLDREIMAQI